jgi:iron-sulfur cluster assembly protein
MSTSTSEHEQQEAAQAPAPAQAQGQGQAEAPARKGITLSDSAVRRLKAMHQELKAGPEAGLRLSVKGGGCSGLTYHMDWAEKPKEKDRIFERDGVRVFVDGKSLLYLNGSELTFESSFMASMFKLHNPNAKTECGCGESFSV